MEKAKCNDEAGTVLLNRAVQLLYFNALFDFVREYKHIYYYFYY